MRDDEEITGRPAIASGTATALHADPLLVLHSCGDTNLHLTAPMLHQGVAVALPKTATTNLPSSIEDPIILSITRDGLYYINETPVARGLLKDRLGAFLKSRKDRTVFLKADRALSYGTVVETLDVLNRMGIENLGMITETPVTRKTYK